MIRSVTRTGPDGQTVTTQSARNVDREAGIATRDTVTTLPDGRTASIAAVTERTDSGRLRTVTRTGPDGQEATRVTETEFDLGGEASVD
jgi:hypothetical protein